MNFSILLLGFFACFALFFNMINGNVLKPSLKLQKREAFFDLYSMDYPTFDNGPAMSRIGAPQGLGAGGSRVLG